jgi:hypothetical protein
VTITFNESVTGFDSSKLTVGNGNIGSFTGTGTTYTFILTPSGVGAVTVDVTANKAQDPALNWNTAATQLSIISIPTATHGGWSDVFAIGPKTKLTSGIESAGNETTLPEEGWTKVRCGGTTNCNVIKWNNFTVSAGAITSYNIYRATTSGGQDFATPIAATTTASRQYIDTSVTPGTTYYYVVRPLTNNAGITTIPMPTTENYLEIKVIAPPKNMALMHRWIANQEICSLMGRGVGQVKGSDPLKNYRCEFNGLGSTFDDGTMCVGANYPYTGTDKCYYDAGSDMLIDRKRSMAYLARQTVLR